MTLDTFFKKFDQFAEAPNAVAKMRELVVQLAVQGGLVPHLPAEPPVAGSSLKDVVPINTTNIPKNWRVLLLADAVKNRSGNSKLIKGTLFDSQASKLFQGFSASGADVWCETYEHEGDAIIISAVGARCGKAFKASGKWCAIANTNITRPDPKLFDFDFAYLVMNDERFWVRGGTAQPFVKFPPSLSRYFAFPPLAEQKRIVAKVDELMALCDRLEAQQQARDAQASALARASLARFAEAPTPANLNLLFHKSYSISPAELRKAILTLAVQGKLVSRIASEGSGSDILHASDVKNRPLDDVPPLPSHWTWAQLGSVTTLMNSGWSPACESTPAAKGAWGVLKTTAVQSLQYVEEQNKALPPALKPRPENEVMDGDILFTRAGPMNRVGILCVARPTRKKLMLSDKIVRFHLIDGIDPDFAALAMTSGYPSACIEELKSGMAASQVNISQPKLRSVPIPIPPLAEQRRIVAKVDQLMALVDQLETQLTTSRVTAKNLLDAVVAELVSNEVASSANGAFHPSLGQRPRKPSAKATKG